MRINYKLNEINLHVEVGHTNMQMVNINLHGTVPKSPKCDNKLLIIIWIQSDLLRKCC